MSIHEHLPPQARRQPKEVGWTKGLELAQLARRDRQHFGATWLHSGKQNLGDYLLQTVPEPDPVNAEHEDSPHNRVSSSRLFRISSRMRFCSALPSEEYSPCFQRERRDLAKPSGVRGPVLAPPCIRHRPLRMAGA
jgi:hypothetical protein